MFGRASTVSISDYFSLVRGATIYPYGSVSGGVYLGKQFTDQYTSGGGTSFNPKLDGWVEYDSLSLNDRIYPDYSMPDDLPPWVKVKDENGNNLQRFLIGADYLIGPFTFQEAIYIYATVRRTKISAEASLSVSAAGFNHSANIPAALSWQYPIDETNPSDPYALFKTGVISASADYDEKVTVDDNLDEDGIGESVNLYTNYGVYAEYLYGDSAIEIVMDVDNYSNYYLSGVPFYYEESASGSASKSIKVPIDGRESEFPDEFDKSTASTGKSKSLIYEIGKFKKTIQSPFYIDGEIQEEIFSNVGDTVTFNSEYEGNVIESVTHTYVTKNIELKFGNITKTMPIYGIQSEGQTFSYNEDVDAPDISISGFGLTNLVLKATDYWPYKNANGQPVYNETTGAIINPPIP